jgi:hypothetical protein
MLDGMVGSGSQPGTFHSMPGWKVGIAVSAASIPELPYEAPEPGPLSSITVTASPRRWSWTAALSPTAPAPITKACRASDPVVIAAA